MTIDPYSLVGVPASPYSRKLRAVFRYRRIPFHWIIQGSPEAAGLPTPKVSLIPQLMIKAENGELVARTDTTPIIRELEELVQNDRSVIPVDPALAFFDALIEDYGDEWLTKAMFHYRWAFQDDIKKATLVLPRLSGMQLPNETLEKAGEVFSSRQIGRLGVVGSNDVTGPLIEESYLRLLTILEEHLETNRFVMGQRPGASDFGLFGQLTQLAQFDPTCMAVCLQTAPRVYAYTDIVEDLSGLEPKDDQWFARDELPSTFHDLLNEIGRVHAPFLLGNHKALQEGLKQVDCLVDGRAWTQKPFPYQGKCLEWLRRDYRALEAGDREFVDKTLVGTGIEILFD
ncbi:MAG: glutathione S-transferase N-terminal domain-containing protein [Myxococcales bacterium]|nr:glutathione S-transferase [Myxococcales bacterium]HIK85717.1 glutathione S-transferase [Myxococcales bacterium]